MKTAEEILAGAADLVEAGWNQGGGGDGGQTVCVVEALAKSAGEQRYLQVEYRAAVDALGMELGTSSFMVWNDTLGRIKEEVVVVIRNAKRHLW